MNRNHNLRYNLKQIHSYFLEHSSFKIHRSDRIAKLHSRVEHIFLIGSIILYSLVLHHGMRAWSFEVPSFGILTWFAPIIATVLLIFHHQEIAAALKQGWRLIPLLLWISVSISWSIDPFLSFKRLLAWLATTAIGMYWGARFSPKQQLQILVQALLIIVIGHWLYIVLIPEVGTMSGPNLGRWSGMYSHRNLLGVSASLGALSFWIRGLYGRPKFDVARYKWWAFYLSSAILVIGSTSRMGIASFGIGLMFLAICKILRHHRAKQKLLIITGCLTVAIALWMVWAPVLLEMAGRDITLSGRLEIWNLLGQYAGDRPWLGYGYGGFWLGDRGYSQQFYELLGRTPNQAHNGFLEIVLAAGIPGLVLFLWGFLYAVRRAIRYIQTNADPTACFPLVFLVLFAVTNMTESHLPNTHLHWAIYVAWQCTTNHRLT